MKWNHTVLPEDVQNQQRSQRMWMIHIVMMNIIHSDTDDNKVSECAGFQSCLPCLSNGYIIYSLIQSNQPFHLCWVGRIILTWFSTLQNTHKCIDWSCHLPSSFDLTFDMFHKILLLICSHLWNHLYITSHNNHTAKDLSLESC